MPSPVRTPESLVARTDSKNPATTCRGITSTGRPCRRALPAATSPTPPADDGHHTLYCWQHKDQAVASAPARISNTLQPLQERTSIDTLVSRLGLTDPAPATPTTKVSKNTRVSENELAGADAPSSAATSRPTSAKRQQQSSFFQKLCCGTSSTADDNDYLEIVRHKDRTRTAQTAALPKATATASSAASIRSQTRHRSLAPPTRPHIQMSLSSPNLSSLTTGGMLSLIPSTLPRATVAQLFAELSKPVSPSDAAGYIYIFWLTPSTSASPSEDLTSALLAPAPPNLHVKRRQGEMLKPFTNDARDHQSAIGAPTHGKLLLKIGRTTNVHRRMTEWSKQCGYNLSLLRWYPYTSTSSTARAQQTSRRPRSMYRPSAPPSVIVTRPSSPDRTPLASPGLPVKSAMKSEVSPQASTAHSNDSSSVSGSVDGSGTTSKPPSSQTSTSTIPEQDLPISASPPKKSKPRVSFSGPLPVERTYSAPAVPLLPLAYQQQPSNTHYGSPYLPPIPTTATPFGAHPNLPIGAMGPPGVHSSANSIRSIRTARTARSGISTVQGMPSPRRIPHAHRTERLIHIELAAKRAAVGKCAACGREHREWFEVEASRDGVREVDEVVRRWVELDMV